jgi:hypothetical protein
VAAGCANLLAVKQKRTFQGANRTRSSNQAHYRNQIQTSFQEGPAQASSDVVIRSFMGVEVELLARVVVVTEREVTGTD